MSDFQATGASEGSVASREGDVDEPIIDKPRSRAIEHWLGLPNNSTSIPIGVMKLAALAGA
jgi:hypothetical protein